MNLMNRWTIFKMWYFSNQKSIKVKDDLGINGKVIKSAFFLNFYNIDSPMELGPRYFASNFFSQLSNKKYAYRILYFTEYIDQFCFVTPV